MKNKKNAGKFLLVVIASSIFLWLFASLPIMGQSQTEESSLLIKKAFDKGEIDKDAYLLHQVEAIFAPKALPVRFKSMAKIVPNRDFTPLVKEISLSWDTLKEETQQKLKPFLIRPTDSSYPVDLGGGPINMAYSVGEAKPHETDHFRIHYVRSTGDAPSLTDSDTNSIPDYVEKMGTTFEDVYNMEIATMGYVAPPNDGVKGGNTKFDVYIKDIGSYGVYGWADAEGSSSGSSWYSFMVMDNDYSHAEFPVHTPLENLQVTAAHEFHHSVQFGYNVYTHTWLMEATSSWIEDEVYDNVNDNLQYLDSVFNAPDTSLDSTVGLHEYGSWIWNRCLSERYERDIIRNIWDKCKLGTDYLPAISQALDQTKFKTNLTDAFVDFTARNYSKIRRYIDHPTDEPYEEGSSYPNIKIENDATPHNVYPVPTQTKLIDHLASRYFKFFPQIGVTSKTLQISFVGPEGKDCGACVVIKTKDGRLIDRRIVLKTQNKGSVIVPGFGATMQNYVDVDQAVLIMNNTTQADDGLEFSYSAQYMNGPDPQITPWNFDWGCGGDNHYHSLDIWVDNDGDGVKNEAGEPSVGLVNKLTALVRNLGNSNTPSVIVKFYYAPSNIRAPYDSDWLIGSKTISLDAGVEKKVTVDWDMTDLNFDNNGRWPVKIKEHKSFCVSVALESPDDINPDNNKSNNDFGKVPLVTPQNRWGLSFHGGATFPITDFGSRYKSSYMFAVDWSYHFTPRLSAVALIGFNDFRAKPTFSYLGNTYWWNLSANLKWEFTTSPTRPYINGGMGAYIPKTGPTKPGYNLGLGIDRTLTPTLVFELGADYHHILTSLEDPEFYTFHAGLIFRL